MKIMESRLKEEQFPLLPEYGVFLNYCKQCPLGSTGAYPNCICDDDGVFDKGVCKTCPDDATDTFGNCKCPENTSYDIKTNYCLQCPEER